jgi:hypothetical protein
VPARSATFVVATATSRPVGSGGLGSAVVGALRLADVGVAALLVVVRRDPFDE